MIKRINGCDIFILITLLYYLQGVLYPSGIINQFLQLVIIIWGLSLTMKTIARNGLRIMPLTGTFLLCLMFSIYGLCLLLFGNSINQYVQDLPSRYIYLQVSLRSLLPIFVFYYYSTTRALTEKRIKIYTFFLIIGNIFRFYETQQNLLLEFGTLDITNNMGYTFTCLIPLLLFFYKKPVVQYSLLSIIMLFTFFALKRGAIIIALVCCVIMILRSTRIYFSNKKKLVAIISMICLVIFAISFIQLNLDSNDYFNRRLEQTIEGDSSNRDQLYTTIFQTVSTEQNILLFLFGRGADSTFAVAGDYAHHDWLETWCNNGLVGVVILFIFFIIIFSDVIKSRKKFIYPYYLSYLLVFIILFSKSIFSMSIQNLEPSQTLLLGYFIYLNRVS